MVDVISPPASPSATSLGKRKAVLLTRRAAPIALVLPEASDDDEEDSAYESDYSSSSSVSENSENPTPPTPLAPLSGRATPLEKKRSHVCTYDGCGKAYSKQSRLIEHIRSHTGERPFRCSECDKAYLRENHLQAHSRTHLPESSRPFVCAEAGCGKRFWTSQHLKVHAGVHQGEKAFCCSEEGCGESFAKHHQLRTHIAEVHCTPGTKPFRCEHEGCAKSFATSQKLRAHGKIHDEKRYICSHLTCLESGLPNYFRTWSALQSHTRSAHPPTCPFPECENRVFASQKGLRGHLKVHEEREMEKQLEAQEGIDERERKRRRGGEIGRDWPCEEEGCRKAFKSKKALSTHHNVTHLKRRDHICPHEDCSQTFGYKHLLQRHLAKVHTSHSPEQTSSDEEGPKPKPAASSIDVLTGIAYTAQRRSTGKTVPCPWPDGLSGSAPSSSVRCTHVFGRAYDLRRHLRADHGLDVEKETVLAWFKGLKQAA